MRWLLAIALVATPAAAQEVTPSTIGMVNIAPTGTPLNLGDDASAPVQLGFTFDYFGQEFTQAWVSSNGFLSFSTSSNLCCDGWPIEIAPRNSIFASWSDLASWSGNPYVQTLSTDLGTAFIAGWYGTQEYGSWLSNSFEIQLYESGLVNIAYGDVINRYHTVTAGITGPTSTDNIEILYGQNIGSLSGTSYSLGSFQAPKTVDCEKTPLDPSCPPIVVTYSPVAISPVQEAVQEAAQEPQATQEEVIAAAEQEIAAAEQVATAVEAAVAEIAATPAAGAAEAEVKQEAEQKADASEKTETKQQAERLSPMQLAALLANRGPAASILLIPGASLDVASQDAQQSDKQADSQEASKQDSQGPSQAMADTQQESQKAFEQVASSASSKMFEQKEQVQEASGELPAIDMAFASQDAQDSQQQPQQMTFAQAFDQMATDTRAFSNIDPVNPQNQAQTIEILNSIPAQESREPEKPSEEMQQLSGNVSLAAYAQARIPDVAFYNEREIYRKNRPVDAYMVMYRLMMTNDRTWSAMVDAQYER